MVNKVLSVCNAT